MLFRYLRRRRIRRTDFPELWDSILFREFQMWGRLREEERAQLRDELRFFIAERHWEGCAGLKMTERIQALIAAQASLLLLGRPEDSFRNVSSVLVYPSGYFAAPQQNPVFGAPRVVNAAPTPVLGQAWERGPVILSWQHAKAGAAVADDGQNVVYHEFAHKLDMLNGLVDGMPRLGSRAEAQRWHAVMTESFDHLRQSREYGHPAPLRPYALTNPAEFFAVATEVFFERPHSLRDWDGDLYDLLRDYFRQDPAERGSSDPDFSPA